MGEMAILHLTPRVRKNAPNSPVFSLIFRTERTRMYAGTLPLYDNHVLAAVKPQDGVLGLATRLRHGG